MTARRGMTLAEILVYACLLAFLLFAVYGMARATLRNYQLAQAEIDLQSQAMVALRQTTSELLMSSPASVAGAPPLAPIHPILGQIVFLSPRDASGKVMYDSGGNILWHKWVSFWADDSGQLWRSEQLLTAPVSQPLTYASAPPASSFRTSPPAVSMRVVARRLSPRADALRFDMLAPRSIRIEAAFSASVFQDGDSACLVTDEVLIRN